MAVVKHIHMDSWIGRTSAPVEVIGETPKRFRVKLLQDAVLPKHGTVRKGFVLLVPKGAVRDTPFTRP